MVSFSEFSQYFPEHEGYLEQGKNAFAAMLSVDPSGGIIVDLLDNIFVDKNWNTNDRVVELAKTAFAEFDKAMTEYERPKGLGSKVAETIDKGVVEAQKARIDKLREIFDDRKSKPVKRSLDEAYAEETPVVKCLTNLQKMRPSDTELIAKDKLSAANKLLAEAAIAARPSLKVLLNLADIAYSFHARFDDDASKPPRDLKRMVEFYSRTLRTKLEHNEKITFSSALFHEMLQLKKETIIASGNPVLKLEFDKEIEDIIDYSHWMEADEITWHRAHKFTP